jgi:hypothetical protein
MGACAIDFSSGLGVHGFMKADVRISGKAYRQKKTSRFRTARVTTEAKAEDLSAIAAIC